jgi:hypothetical protein
MKPEDRPLVPPETQLALGLVVSASTFAVMQAHRNGKLCVKPDRRRCQLQADMFTPEPICICSAFLALSAAFFG